MINPFLNCDQQLRNGWWILIFFLVLSSFLVPIMVAAQKNDSEVSIGIQGIITVAACVVITLLLLYTRKQKKLK
jgi:uncharacterized protein